MNTVSDSKVLFAIDAQSTYDAASAKLDTIPLLSGKSTGKGKSQDYDYAPGEDGKKQRKVVNDNKGAYNVESELRKHFRLSVVDITAMAKELQAFRAEAKAKADSEAEKAKGETVPA